MEKETFFKIFRNKFLTHLTGIIENDKQDFDNILFINLESASYGPVNKAGIKEVERTSTSVTINCKKLPLTIENYIVFETPDGNLFTFRRLPIKAMDDGNYEFSSCIADIEIPDNPFLVEYIENTPTT